MRYLCFDIECCDGQHICEFGYVVTDDKFNIIEKEDILINPENKFHLTGRKNQQDLILHFSEEEYYSSLTFPNFYNKIKTLLEYKDQIIIGHAIINDAKFLNIACKRYSLPSLNFEFFDSQKAYEEYSKFNSISLENAGKELGIEKPTYLHKSDDDAYLTICVVKSLCEHMGATLTELKDLCIESSGKNTNYYPQYFGNSLEEKLNKLAINSESLSRAKQKTTIFQLSTRIKPQCKIKKSILNDKKLCFGTDFEREHLKETLILIQILSNYGCKYNRKVSENDYYVATENELLLDNKENKHNRYYAATEVKDDGRNVEVIDFNQLYSLLGVTKEEIENMKWPDAKFFNIGKKIINNPKRNEKKEIKTTLAESNADIFKELLLKLK